MTTTSPTPSPTPRRSGSPSERLVRSLSRRLTVGDRPGRRSFLRRAAMVGTALAVNPLDFILRPQSAYGSVCGPANECSQGWSAFCCTINAGANTCPEGSYAAGWWKVSSSAFCRGGDRYVVDCNRLPQARCSCHCADGPCDRRRVCCNNFRYGQCNQQIAGTTEVVCRIVICTPPWEWDDSCTTTVRTDERTRDHNATCLNPPDPTEIAVVYQDLGLVGSPLGAPVGEEQPGPDGGSWRPYEHGAITRVAAFGVVVASGPGGVAYRELDGPSGPLGYLTGPAVEVAGGMAQPTEDGVVYTAPDGSAEGVHGPLQDAYAARGGPAGWLGFPTSDVEPAPGDRLRVTFAAGWSLVLQPGTGEVRLLPSDVTLSETPGEWPSTAGVARWSGADRIATAVTVSREARPDGADTVILAAAADFPDALAGGVLAGARGGPVLLTDGRRLSAASADELVRLSPDRVVLVGGEAAMSAAVAEDVGQVLPGATVERLAGADRFATAAAVAVALAGEEPVEQVLVASGRGFPDALSASPLGAVGRHPLLLVEPDAVPSATADALERLEPGEVVVVGGEAAVSAAVADRLGRLAGTTVTRIAGQSRAETAAAVALRLAGVVGDGTVAAVLVATGGQFPDALAAGAAAALVGAVLLLVESDDVPAATRHAIAELRPQLIVVVGGTAAVSDVVVEQLQATPTEP